MPDFPFNVRLPSPTVAVHACDNTSCETSQTFSHSCSAWARGDLEQGMRLAVAASRIQPECAGNCKGVAKVWYSLLLIRIRELTSGARALASVDELMDKTADSSRLVPFSLICAANLAFVRGDVKSTITYADKGIHQARAAGQNHLLPSGHTVMALSALRQGNMSAGLIFANRLRDDALLGHTAYSPSQCAWVTAQFLEVQSGVTSAGHLIEGIITDDQLILELLASQPAAASWLVRATRKLGDETLAKRVVSEASRLATRNRGIQSLKAAEMHAGGLLEENPHELVAAAESHLDRWASASAYEDAGRLLSSERQEREQAVDLLERAIEGYSKAAAPRDARRSVSRLRSLGVRRGRYPQYATLDGASEGSLTNSEAAVAELVSQGFTNSQVGERLFISGHTVAFHLKKIFRKMNVSSRVELTRTWSQFSGDTQ